MGAFHNRLDSASTQNTTHTMADIDGYSQSQRDFYTVNPHLYAQQGVKSSSKGPQHFHLNAADANGGAAGSPTNGSLAPVHQPRPCKAEVIFDMTPHEIKLTQELWGELMTDPETLEKSAAYGTPTALFCEQFYTNLMAAHAEISSIFPSIKKQSIAVAGVFGLAIKRLNNIEEMDPLLLAVGKRHNRMIGVEPIHYRWLGEAMVKTFADRFGERFTLEVETAWIKIYSYLANKLLASDEEPNVLLFAPQKRFHHQQQHQQHQQQSMLSSSPQGQAPGISPTSSYNMGGYQTTQDVRKPSISSSLNSHSINTQVSNSTAPTSMVNSVNHNNNNGSNGVPAVPVTPNNNNNNAAAAAAAMSRRNVSAAPSVPSSLPSAPAPAAMATDSSATKNRMKAGRKHRKGKDDEKCVIA